MVMIMVVMIMVTMQGRGQSGAVLGTKRSDESQLRIAGGIGDHRGRYRVDAVLCVQFWVDADLDVDHHDVAALVARQFGQNGRTR